MPDESHESPQNHCGSVDPERRAFLRGGLSLVGGTVLASAALELLCEPAPAFGAPPARSKQNRPTCLAVVVPDPAENPPPPQRVLTCEDGFKLFLWTMNSTGGFDPTKFDKEHVKKASYVTVSRNMVLTASFDGTLIVRALNNPGANAPPVFNRHLDAAFAPAAGRKAEVFVAALSADGTRALSGDNFGNILYWDTNVPAGPNPPPFLNKFKDANEWVSALSFMPELPNTVQKRFISGHENGKMVLWDFRNVPQGENVVPAPPLLVKTEFAHPTNKYPINAIATDSHGSIVVSADFDGLVRIWDVGNNANPRQFLELSDQIIWRIAISPDDQTLAVAMQDGLNRKVGRVRLFDISNPAAQPPPEKMPPPQDENGGVMGVGFLDDHNVVYTTGDSRGAADQIKVFNF